MKIVKTEAIVIKEMNYSESSKIVTLFSLKKGKVRVIAKGSRRIKNKFSNAVNLFNYLKIIYYEKEGKELYTLSEADLIESYSNIQSDVKTFAYASLFVEIIDRGTSAFDSNSYIFYLLLNYLQTINKSKKPQEITTLFLIKFLSLIGIQPILDHCVKCGAREVMNIMDIAGGGLICGRCKEKNKSYERMNEGMVKTMQKTIDEKIPRLTILKVPEKQLQKLSNILMKYYSYHLEGSFKSLEFLKKL